MERIANPRNFSVRPLCPVCLGGEIVDKIHHNETDEGFYTANGNRSSLTR